MHTCIIIDSMQEPRTYRDVLEKFKKAPTFIQEYFKYLPDLVANFPWDVSIGYLFTRIEYAKHMTIYCGILKLHSADSTLTWKAIENLQMTREQFINLFKIVFRQPIESSILKKLRDSENVRDMVVHGKNPHDSKIRKAMVDAIDFCIQFNDYVYKRAGFRPMAKLVGFKGRKKSLDKSTTRWLLKGMGFNLS